MVLAIGSDGFGVGLTAVQPVVRGRAVGVPFPDNGPPADQGGSSGPTPSASQSPPLTGLQQQRLAPGSARQAQEQQSKEAKTPGSSDLTPAQQAEVAKLKQIDQAVRRHEQAHSATGGQFAGAPSYSYVQGPDGQRYAVAGEVPINASPISGDPAATIRKEEQVVAAALAPADPSGQDRAVAASAQQLKNQAQAELTKKQQEQAAGGSAPQDRKSPIPGVPSGVGASQTHPGIAAYRQATSAAAGGAAGLSIAA
ncbi:MAG: hypothetical protein HYR63_00635 [Proteobacteria bacterium]|nr:hypothetical protein [Pseudomonadota bacterium]MBI3499326.1 hypothetical protein [Pseudomonadota bacterium]